VRAPAVILAHHAVTVGFALIPWLYRQYAPYFCPTMAVEVNTFLLIARRVAPPGGRLGAALSVAFYASWAALRLILYPYLTYAFYRDWRAHSAAAGDGGWSIVAAAPLCQGALTALGLYWTAELLLTRARQRKRRFAALAGGKAD
jgi:hypothetical protein